MNLVDGQSSIVRRIFAVDLRSLAVFRMLVGTMLLVDLCYRYRNLEMLFTDSGFLPRQGITETYGPSIAWTSLHYHTGAMVWLQGFMLVITTVAAIAILVGYRTWLATFIAWVLFVSLNRRIPATCYGFDDVMRLLLVWSLLLPTNAKWSLDCYYRPRQIGNAFCSVASAGILLQVCYIYWFTALWKVHPDWLEGRALQYAMQLDFAIRPLGQWLQARPALTVPLTYAALISEFLMPCFALSPWKNDWGRWVAILAMWGMHAGIWICISIGLFPPIAITYWVLFIPTSTWDALEHWWRPRSQDARIETNPDNVSGFSRPYLNRMANIAAAVLILQITAYNLLGLPQARRLGIRMSKTFATVTEFMRVDQTWNLYAPTPNVKDGWYVMPAVLADGSTADIWLNAPVDYAKPKLPSSTFPDFRATMLLMNSREKPKSPIWPWVARYIVRRWNSQHDNEQSVRRMQIVFVGEHSHDGQQYLTPMLEFDAAQDQPVPLSTSPIGGGLVQ